MIMKAFGIFLLLAVLKHAFITKQWGWAVIGIVVVAIAGIHIYNTVDGRFGSRSLSPEARMVWDVRRDGSISIFNALSEISGSSFQLTREFSWDNAWRESELRGENWTNRRINDNLAQELIRMNNNDIDRLLLGYFMLSSNSLVQLATSSELRFIGTATYNFDNLLAQMQREGLSPEQMNELARLIDRRRGIRGDTATLLLLGLPNITLESFTIAMSSQGVISTLHTIIFESYDLVRIDILTLPIFGTNGKLTNQLEFFEYATSNFPRFWIGNNRTPIPQLLEDMGDFLTRASNTQTQDEDIQARVRRLIIWYENNGGVS